MARLCASASARVLIVCLATATASSNLLASGNDAAPGWASSLHSVASNASQLRTSSPAVKTPDDAATARAWEGVFRYVPAEPYPFAASQFRGRRGRGRRNGAAAAIAAGAIASIAGAAILVYANRPDCGRSDRASGCGYGTKVAGGAVLSAGIVGLVAGAVMVR